MTDLSPTGDSLIRHDALVDLLARIFERHGCSETVARILAANCAGCERDGSFSHGVFRIPGYVGSLTSGWVDGRAVPVLEEAGPTFLRADAANGFAQPALEAARPRLMEMARSGGMALLAIRNSHHFSALWPDVEPFAREGLVALSVVNSFACVVPHGGHSAVYGTNPMAFATPCAGGEPIVFDQAASSMANGDVRIAAREGHDLPPGYGVDRDGVPTTDPRAVLDGGALLPFGGHKGSSIAFLIEVLSAALTGGKFSFEVDWSAHPGAETPHTGQLLILIDPARGGNAGFAERVLTLTDRVRAAGQMRMPGDRRHVHRARTDAEGIPLGAAKLAELRALA
ncbi:delta1-piperideine-2-carboxylate reductase [Azospirillum agricola]|uniref:Ldh family oxidoreductase n=1 Tax=Azospirillum agricola TaxID=1720247 RepID=UPI001F1B5509|nr:Ldh family oxidoreductase [Azospirillum agricola]MBP2231077.1 delta1-piperideine-2-carboxylate reductase [Azospirillum agricola]